MFTIPKPAQAAISQLQSAGYEAYLVGGCVRDFLMGKEPKDYDLTTNATPQEMKTVFARDQLIETGIKHGTVTVVKDRQPLEITTYRIESTYSDCRHPDAVQFTDSLSADLSRRDFTMNAIAYHPEGLVDPFHGRADLEKRLIRCVGCAEERFREDALRILRALRFSSVLDFSIEVETAAAIHLCAPLLRAVSAERIRDELTKLLCGTAAGRILRDYADVVCLVIPELQKSRGFQQRNPHHCDDVYLHTVNVVAQSRAEPILRWAALLHDIGKPDAFSVDDRGIGHFYGHAQVSGQLADEILRRMKFDNSSRERIVLLVTNHGIPIVPEKRAVKRLVCRLGMDAAAQLLQLNRADNLGLAPEFQDRQNEFDRLDALLTEIREEDACLQLKDLAVNGNDLKALGVSGKAIGVQLSQLLDAVIEEQVENQKEALLSYLGHFAHKQETK